VRFLNLFYKTKLIFGKDVPLHPFYCETNPQVMVKQKRKVLFFAALILLLFSLYLLAFSPLSTNRFFAQADNNGVDLPQIIERGVLRATTNLNSTNYFVYRGEPMGFHFELLRLFAEHIGVELEIYATNDPDENLNCLLAENECDVIAIDFPVTKSGSNLVRFIEPHNQERQVLVQRKPDNYHLMRQQDMEALQLRNQLDLDGKTIYVPRNSVFVERLQNLMQETGAAIDIVEVDYDAEQLIEMVSNGSIDFTVSHEHLARINASYFENIDFRTPLSFPQKLAWAVRRNAPLLQAALSDWMTEFKDTPQFVHLYNRYFNNPRNAYIARSPFSSLGGGKISVFDSYFRQHADIVGWDWRLIASVAFQESRFNPDAVSWAGARGIMQLMPATAEIFDIDSTSSISDHIYAGVSYLLWLENTLANHIPDSTERIKFVLAAYNVGIGHVMDAIRLAKKHGKNPEVWTGNVDYFVLNKSNPKYYQDEVVRFGFARGSEPYAFVIEILDRFRHYKNVSGL
jgi:membrane-bound lytic murein transglycosylase F